MKIALSTAVVDKARNDQFKTLNGSFGNVDVSLTELAEHVSRGHPFCAQHSEGWRRKSNFLNAGFLAVDIDRGITVEDALAFPYVQRFGGLLYTTPSHTNDHHRFRIVFELEQPIDSQSDMEQALSGLIARFGGDEACRDACRLFYGSKDCRMDVLNNVLPSSEVSELIERARELAPRFDSVAVRKSSRSAVRSRIVLPPDTSVRTKDGRLERLDALPPDVTIHCPKHEDVHPSAFTLRSKGGTPGLYCSKCVTTFFLTDEPPTYDFNYSLPNFLNISPEEYEAYANEDGHVSLSEVRGGLVQVMDSRYLRYDEDPIVISPLRRSFDDAAAHIDGEAIDPFAGFEPNRNITFIRSPKGTGKTEWLGKLIRTCKAHRVSVLLVGHRQSLISSSAERLGLCCYFNHRTTRNGKGHAIEYANPTEQYAVCLDSLPVRLKPALNKYDVLIIDEVEQVLAHLLSDTLKDRRREALHALIHYLRQAKALYVLDADLNRVTVTLLAEMLREKPRSWQFLVNAWRNPNGMIHVYDNKDHLKSELIESLERGERCFVAANSKRLVRDLHKFLEARFGASHRFKEIDADNAQWPENQSFIKNIKEEILSYDCVLASPALGTGIDITFKDDAQFIDTVFGFFEARVNTHFDIDQQLSRVRNPKKTCVWVSPEEFRFETDPRAIKAEVREIDGAYRHLLGYEANGEPRYLEDSMYEMVIAEITALQRGSKNRLRKNFCELRKHNGWNIVVVAEDADAKAAGKQITEESRRLGWEDWVARITCARILSRTEYERLKELDDIGRLVPGDQDAMRRYEIEWFYYQTVSDKLLVLDNYGRFRDAIRRLELLSRDDGELRDIDSRYRKHFPADRLCLLVQKKLLTELFKLAGVLDRSGAFDPSVEVSKNTLVRFGEQCSKYRRRIERLFGIPVRSDVLRKTSQQLGVMLELVGLGLTRSRIQKIQGRKYYFYCISEFSLRNALEVVGRRASPLEKASWLNARKAVDQEQDEIGLALERLRERRRVKESRVSQATALSV